MPANLTPQYKEAEERFRSAAEPEEKLAALREMIALLPKHKGTEKLHADLKRRLSKLLNEAKQRSKAGRKVDVYHVDKEGNPQIAVIGPPNAGKSSLVARLTGAVLQVAPYPYTTSLPVPAMMSAGGALVQLVDTPPFMGGDLPNWLPNLVRNADAVLVVVDGLDEESIGTVEALLAALAEKRVFLESEANTDLPVASASRACILAVNKVEGEEGNAGLELARDLYAGRLVVRGTSNADAGEAEELKEALFGLLGLIRVFTKQPGKPPDRDRPFLLPRGSTIEDLAASIHKEVASKLRFARIWGSGAFDGQQVSSHHLIEDGDVVEIHA